MNFRILLIAAALILFSSVASHAGESPFRTREPLPWNLLENGGFERDGTGLFAVGQGQRDRDNPATGDASGRFDIPAGKDGLILNISSGLRLENDKDYIVSGRIRTAFKAADSEASLHAAQLNVAGSIVNTLTAHRARGTMPWQMFALRMRGDGQSSLRLSLNAKGQPGESVWLDDLYVGPARIDLSWNAVPGSGLLQAIVADGTQFEFPIPPQAHVMGVFRNGQRLFETKECDVLYGANVVRLFEIPVRGEHISVVLRSTLGKAQLPASPLYRYALYSKSGKVDAWLPDAIENFKAPSIDYAALEREVIDLPSIDGLPVEWTAESQREIALKVHSAGRYAIRLRDEKRRLVASLADFVPLPAGGMLQVKFNGCDDSGVPLLPGNYVWDVEHRPLNAFPHLESLPVELFVGGVWRVAEGWMTMKLRPVNGRPAQGLTLTDDRLKDGERKGVIPTAQVESVVQARPGVFFYFDLDSGQIFKLENGTAAVFPKAAITAKGQKVLLSPYETPEGPGLFVSRSGGPEAMVPALLKLDAKGEAVPTFGEGGQVGPPVLQAPGAVVALEDGGVLVADSRGSAWLKRLGPDGSARKNWRARRGEGLSEAAWIENSESAYATFRRSWAPLSSTPLNRRATQILIAPSGEIVLAVQDAGSGSSEVQVYSPRGEFLHAIGTGPQQSLAMETPGYPRLWDASSSTGISLATNLSFDARGDLAVFDRNGGRVMRWAFAPRVSNLAMTIKSAAKPEVSGRMIPPSQALLELQQRHGFKTNAVDYVDLSESGAGHGLRDDGTSSVIRKAKLSPYRLSGTEHGSWFGTQLRGARPGKAHVLIVEYPDDAPRATGVTVSFEGEMAAVQPGVSAGYVSGGAYPLSGQMRYYTVFVYPRTTTIHVGFRSVLGGPVNALTGAAASRIWLLEVDGPLPANPVEEPLTGVKRVIQEHRTESDVLLAEFGTGEEADKAKGLLTAAQSSAAFHVFIGLNGEDVEAPALNTKDDGTKEIARAVLEAPGATGGVYFTYYGLRGIPREAPALKDLGLVNEFGHADANNLSVVYPEAQQYFRDTIAAFVQQCSATPRFAGVTIQLNTHAPPLFGVPGAVGAGYEAASLTAFEKASQKTIPGGTLQEKIVHLKTTLREEFSVWRCTVVADWVFSVRDAIKKIRPDLQLRLQTVANADLRFHGFDRALFNNAEGIRLIDMPPNGDLLHVTRGEARAQWADLKPETPVDILEFRAGSAGGLTPNREHVLAPLVAALVRQNPREISLRAPGRSSAGWELELREFARAFRSLPAGPAEELKGAAAAMKVYRFGGKGAVQYLAVVNPTEADLKETVRVSDASAQTVRDLVQGKDLTPIADARGVSFEISVPAGNLRTYRVGK